MKWRVQRKALLLALLTAGTAAAQTPASQILSQPLGEQVVMVPKGSGPQAVELETTIYRPPGPGPFPVVIINHGKSEGDTRLQDRARYVLAAREFVQRGYLVVLPMRQGFSKSGGAYVSTRCDLEANGRAQAQDVVATLAYLRTQRDADMSRVVVAGQSHGGLATLALGALNHPGVKGLINFAGGLRLRSCDGWESRLSSAVAAYGRATRVPSLWFYGDNDSYWKPALYREMHDKYVQAGGRARLVAFGLFSDDAHQLLGARLGLPIWLPEVEKFLGELRLPTRKLHSLALVAHEGLVPVSTGFAPWDDERALPHVKQAARDGYLRYVSAEEPKAFAIAPNGAWAYVTGRSNVMSLAVSRCNTFAKENICRLYAVDQTIVWKK